jgi:hypothetical protein
MDIYCDWQWESIKENNLQLSIQKLKDISISIHKDQIDEWENKVLDF